MQTFDQALLANAEWPTGVKGSYFRLMVAVSPVNVILYRNGIPIYTANNVLGGLWTRPSGGFDAVKIVNGATAQSVQIGILDGDGGYDHLVVDIASQLTAIAVNIAGAADVTVGQGTMVLDLAPATALTAATLLFSASTASESLRVRNDTTINITLGGPAVTPANGVVVLAPGEVWLEDNGARAEWYGVATAAAAGVKLQRVTR